jgi:hypothetical protein
MSGEKRVLEIYRQQGVTNSPISTREFDSLASLRIAIVENRARSFIVREPRHATSQVELLFWI